MRTALSTQNDPPASIPTDVAKPSGFSLDRRDWALVAALSVAAGVAFYCVAGLMPSTLFTTKDFWFEADTVREVSNMTSVKDDHYRTSVHPLISLITYTPVYIVRHLLSLGRIDAAIVVASVIGGVWIGTLYLMLRLIGCRKLDACLFTAVGLSSAASLFWIPIPNAYSWGSLSIMAALCLLLLEERRRFTVFSYVVVSALTLSMTVTNWMAGLLVTLAKWPWRKAIQLSVNAFCLVVVLWGVQKFLFPTAEFFLSGRKELSSVGHAQMGGVHHVAQSFFLHSLVAPAIRFIDDEGGYVQVGDDSVRLSQRLTFQFSTPGSAGPMGIIAVASWALLLLIGGWRMVTEKRLVRFRIVLCLLLAFELSLHLVYGEETFVHSLHYTPLLIGLASLGTFGPGRPFVLMLGGLFLICGAANNWQQFRHAAELSTLFTPQREIVSQAMQKDPNRPWPRGAGHIVLGTPGAPEAMRAYHEPGGDFSPETPSFGVSFWLCDASGHPVVTSQTVPLRDIQQTFEPSTDPDIPDIVTRTPYYEARWSRLDARRWQLRFHNHTAHVPNILIRSVGPAGGPIVALSWNGRRVQINDRWVAEMSPTPAQVSLGDENATDWMTAQSASQHWAGEAGWGYARLVLTNDPARTQDEYRLVVSDVRIPIDFGKGYSLPSTTTAHLPDERFSASMEAQRLHLMMSLVDQETRPGDPVHFNRAWNQPGSYVIAALARAGDPHTSKVLSRFLAMQDFIGGYGAEGDQPGLALWALTEAARYIADPDHDAGLWPHINRKAGHIEHMLAADKPLVKSTFVPNAHGFRHGQQTHESVLANPSRDGLIMGRVGREWPPLYVNAVSYRGLLAAAEMAERLGKRGHATKWREKAKSLQTSWQQRFLTGAIDHQAYTVGLWPSAIAVPILDRFDQHLSAYQASDAGRESVTAQVAQAHQQLRLGRPEAVWNTLRDLWDHQASPGLYTWETASPGISDVADGWQYIRGWRKDSVTPDYETAAQLLLLQQDMLAYWDDSVSEPTVVIGGGIPTAWLSQPLSVSNLPVPGGEISWQWDGRRMRVSISGPFPKVRLGRAFPQETAMVIVNGNL